MSLLLRHRQFTPDAKTLAREVRHFVEDIEPLLEIISVEDDDEIVLDGAAHASTHEDGGSDEINLGGLSGTPAALTTHAALTGSSAHGLGTVSTLASDTDGTLAANSDTRVATQKATKTYVDATVASGGLTLGKALALSNAQALQ